MGDTKSFPVVPKNVVVAGNDFVSFTTYKRGIVTHYTNEPCYAKLYPLSAETSVLCQPAQTNKCAIQCQIYLEWMSLCQLNGLIPKTVVFYTERNENYLFIPQYSCDIYLYYIALCCYRYSATCAPLVWEVVQLSRMSKATFWQNLHYALFNKFQKYSGGPGHNFSCIGPVSASIYSHDCPSPVADSLAIKHFVNMSSADRIRISQGRNTQMSLLTLADQFDRSIVIKQREHILSPSINYLYDLSIEQFADATIKSNFSQVVQEANCG